jgi:sulfur carrier protein
VQIELNGAPREVPEGATIGSLLAELGLKRDGIAVAVHMRVVPRGEHDRTALQPGDKVEIIQAVGGG